MATPNMNEENTAVEIVENRSLLINLQSFDTQMLLKSGHPYKIPLVLSLSIEDKEISSLENVNQDKMAYVLKQYENSTIIANIVRQEACDCCVCPLDKEMSDNEDNARREKEMKNIENMTENLAENTQYREIMINSKPKWYAKGGCMQSCNSPDFEMYEPKKQPNFSDLEIGINGKETAPQQLYLTLKLIVQENKNI